MILPTKFDLFATVIGCTCILGPPLITEMNVAAPPHLRLYEFAKTALIKIFAFPYATVRYIAPLFCGFQFVANQRETLGSRILKLVLHFLVAKCVRSVTCIAMVELIRTSGVMPRLTTI